MGSTRGVPKIVKSTCLRDSSLVCSLALPITINNDNNNDDSNNDDNNDDNNKRNKIG